MTESSSTNPPTTDSAYDVVLLIEEQLSELDAQQVWSLHDSIEGPVSYHVLLPLDDAAARVEASLGSLSGGELLAAPAMTMDAAEIAEARQAAKDRCVSQLDSSVAALRAVGATVAEGTVVSGSPTDALAEKVAEVDGREAIVMTRPHVVAEFFHLDWTSKARRKLGVPVLHLLEHETFDEQASGPDGISGL